jgi:CheY-like chemotaxis protein
MGDFGAILRLGLWEILEGTGRDLVTEVSATAELMERLVATVPDVVVLDMDTEGIEELAARIAQDYPAVKIIACSSVAPVMRIFPPFHHGESYLSDLSPDLLVEAVNRKG